MTKIDVIQTDKFALVKGGYSALAQLLFDGELPQAIFSKDGWLKVKGRPAKLEKLVSQPAINHRFELKDKSLASDKIPAVLKCEDVAVYVDYNWEWLAKYEGIESLYALVYDTPEPKRELVEFEWNVISTVPSIEDYEQFGYIVDRGRYKSDGTTLITNKDVTHPILDTALFPEPLLASRHSSLTSQQAYAIIRKHIQENINPAAAYISSDYDFCFIVQKRIKLAKPYQTKYEEKKVGGKSYRPPRFTTNFYSERKVEVFEMTHEGAKYAKYTPIQGFSGANEGELKQNIDAFLEKLMLVINEPLVECACCQGAGVVDPTKVA